MEHAILVINAGSSSVKFALYVYTDVLTCTLSGKMERIGLPHSRLMFTDASGHTETREITLPDNRTAIDVLNYFLHERINFDQLTAVGHRIVHGMGASHHQLISDQLLSAMRTYVDVDPEHLPFQLDLIDSFSVRHPALKQVACFDTVFHHDMPRVAQLLPFPRHYESLGMRRYGFHGLSCAYVMEELARIDAHRALGKVIILHLGSGASVTALVAGKTVDTSMGFSPSSGVPMSSRSGDIDGGALSYLLKIHQLDASQIDHLLNYQSGLLGVSETSADMYDLLQIQESDVRAQEAIDFFCYEVKKRIGAYVAALGGVETIIFTGGIGAVAPHIRAQICGGLESFGVIIDESKNQANDALISSTLAPVYVHVMHTDEERMIAQITRVI